DVEVATQQQTRVKGIALQKPTNVYRNASTNSSTWRSYDAGSVLIYQTFSDNWYQATVLVNGAWRTGYIHKSHVENVFESQESHRGVAVEKSTTVYQKASTSSKGWKS